MKKRITLFLGLLIFASCFAQNNDFMKTIQQNTIWSLDIAGNIADVKLEDDAIYVLAQDEYVGFWIYTIRYDGEVVDKIYHEFNSICFPKDNFTFTSRPPSLFHLEVSKSTYAVTTEIFEATPSLILDKSGELLFGPTLEGAAYLSPSGEYFYTADPVPLFGGPMGLYSILGDTIYHVYTYSGKKIRLGAFKWLNFENTKSKDLIAVVRKDSFYVIDISKMDTLNRLGIHRPGVLVFTPDGIITNYHETIIIQSYGWKNGSPIYLVDLGKNEVILSDTFKSVLGPLHIESIGNIVVDIGHMGLVIYDLESHKMLSIVTHYKDKDLFFNMGIVASLTYSKVNKALSIVQSQPFSYGKEYLSQLMIFEKKWKLKEYYELPEIVRLKDDKLFRGNLNKLSCSKF